MSQLTAVHVVHPIHDTMVPCFARAPRIKYIRFIDGNPFGDVTSLLPTVDALTALFDAADCRGTSTHSRATQHSLPAHSQQCTPLQQADPDPLRITLASGSPNSELYTIELLQEEYHSEYSMMRDTYSHNPLLVPFIESGRLNLIERHSRGPRSAEWPWTHSPLHVSYALDLICECPSPAHHHVQHGSEPRPVPDTLVSHTLSQLLHRPTRSPAPLRIRI